VEKKPQPKDPALELTGSAFLYRFKRAIFRLTYQLRNFGLVITAILPTSCLRIFVYRTLFRMKIGPKVYIDRDCHIFGPKRITIKAHAIINRGVVLDGRFPLVIEENASISMYSVILTLQHDLSDPDFISVGAPVTIGKRAFIGTRAIIMPGISIGKGASVAAGAVVTKNVDDFQIVAGVPARVIGSRPANLRYTLSLVSSWP
jgi:acetyltransferase-like isoleucine patch superfamily enzyme